MIEIPLTQGKVAIVDDCDAHLLKWKWFCNGGGYAARNIRKFNGVRGTMFLHHCIIGFPLNKKEIDHIDGNVLNDCRNNLRIVTHRENTSNKICHRNGRKTSKFVGVSWHKDKELWTAHVTIEGKQKNLGNFKTELEARKVYLNAVLTAN